MKKNILLVVHTNTWFTEIYRVARLLLESSGYSPVVFFAYQYPTIQADMKKLDSLQIPYSQMSEGLILDGHIGFKVVEKFFNLIVRILSVGFLQRFTKFISPVFKFNQLLLTSLREISFYRKLIRQKEISLVAMAGDMVGYNTAEIARAAREEKIPCVVVPSTMSDGTEQAEAYFFNSSFSFEFGLNKLIGSMWPKWKKQHKGKWLVRLPAEQILVREILHLDPPLPWVSSSTRADCIAVESRAMKDYYLRCGIATELLKETGSLANDGLYQRLRDKEQLKKNLLVELGLDPAKKMVLTALPPDFLYMPGGRPECEFKDYRELTLFWIQQLAAMNQFNIVISLHPSVNIEDFRYLESENVKIYKETIINLIPLCDLFVASVSSTIRWAIACAKPVINYDVYVYRYSDFTAVQGVVYMDKKAQYVENLRRLNEDPGYLSFLEDLIAKDAGYWGNLDGQEGRRLLQLFDQLISSRAP